MASEERQEQQGHWQFRAVTPACDLQVCQLDVVVEDISLEVCNLIALQVTAKVAGCWAGTGTDDERP